MSAAVPPGETWFGLHQDGRWESIPLHQETSSSAEDLPIERRDGGPGLFSELTMTKLCYSMRLREALWPVFQQGQKQEQDRRGKKYRHRRKNKMEPILTVATFWRACRRALQVDRRSEDVETKSFSTFVRQFVNLISSRLPPEPTEEEAVQFVSCLVQHVIVKDDRSQMVLRKSCGPFQNPAPVIEAGGLRFAAPSRALEQEGPSLGSGVQQSRGDRRAQQWQRWNTRREKEKKKMKKRQEMKQKMFPMVSCICSLCSVRRPVNLRCGVCHRNVCNRCAFETDPSSFLAYSRSIEQQEQGWTCRDCQRL